MVETILSNNYVADTMARGNEEIADDSATTEGKTVSSEELGREFFENLGYAFGYDTDAPWNEMSPASPRLYFEKGLIIFDQNEYDLAVGSDGDLAISLFGEQIDDDTLGKFIIEIAEESIIEYVNLSVVDGKIIFTVKGLKEGTTIVTANYNGITAKTSVKVSDLSGIENTSADASMSIEYKSGIVTAEGCLIEVYSIAGMKLLDGTGSCDLGGLANGVYVVIATDKSGQHSALKVMR